MEELLKHDFFWIEGYLSYFRRMATQAILTRTVRSGSITTLPPGPEYAMALLEKLAAGNMPPVELNC
jgi:hypothetical protein